MYAREISAVTRTTLKTRPVFSQGIMQHSLQELTSPCAAEVNGLWLELPPSTVISVIGGGTGGTMGSLMTDLVFQGRDGKTYRATQGMQIRIPTA